MNINLTVKASRLIYTLAQDEAKKLCCEQVLPEHVLIALIKAKEGNGYNLLTNLKINIDELLKILNDSLVTKPLNPALEIIPNSRRLATMVDLAYIEAQTLGKTKVGTEHLVLGAIRENASVTANFFQNNDISINVVRNLIKELFKDENIEINNSNAFKDLFFKDLFYKENNSKNIELNDNSKIIRDDLSKSKNSSFFNEFARDITNLAKENKIDPVIGRTKELTRVIQILSRRTKNNPVLVGESGVGKTSIVEGLAQKIIKGEVPSGLINKKIYSLDLAALIAGTKYRGEFEERIKRLIKEIKENPNIILFVDELHTIIGAGGSDGALDVSNILKPALGRGEIQIIGATTNKEYNKYIEKDSALERRFHKINVYEPSEEDCVQILNGIKSKFESFHGVIYEEGVIDAVVKLSKRYITERFLPDKAIDLLDEAGACVKIKDNSKPNELIEIEKEIELLVQEKKALVSRQDYEKAAIVRDKVLDLKTKLDLYIKYWNQQDGKRKLNVTVNDICNIISENTGIPLEQLDSEEMSRLSLIEQELQKSVVGQDEAVHLVSNSIRRSRVGISSPNHPIGSFVFLGPTGVGKTQLAKSLTKFLFGTESKLIRIDMSDFMEKHNASRLVGAPPGYVGYEDGGILTEKIRKNPYSVILLDEIEKAHPDVFNLLLQLLEEGELSDNLGHTINFRNTVVIMTSNAGARQITTDSKVGFSSEKNTLLSYEEIKASAMNELKKILNPELINRIDEVVVFNPLSKKDISVILDIQLNELSSRLKEKGYKIELSLKAKEYLIDNGYESSMGARPMKRLIQKTIEDKIAMAIINNELKDTNIINIDLIDDELKINSPIKSIKIKDTVKIK